MVVPQASPSQPSRGRPVHPTARAKLAAAFTRFTTGTGKITRPDTSRHQSGGGDRWNRKQPGQKAQAVGDQTHCCQMLSALEKVAGQPLVREADRESQHLLKQYWPDQMQYWPHRSSRSGNTAATRRVLPKAIAAQVNRSLITLPELAIFMGRPFLAVKVVSSEMPSDLSTLAMTSCDE